MTIKSIVQSIARYFLAEDEIRELLPEVTSHQRALDNNVYMRRTAVLLGRDTKEYKLGLQAAEDFLLEHHGSTSIIQMCRSLVRKNASHNYYLVAALGNLIERHYEATGAKSQVSGGEANALLVAIDPAVVEASAEKNFIKKRAIVRKAVAAHFGDLDTDTLAAIVELVLQIKH